MKNIFYHKTIAVALLGLLVLGVGLWIYTNQPKEEINQQVVEKESRWRDVAEGEECKPNEKRVDSLSRHYCYKPSSVERKGCNKSSDCPNS